MEVDSENTLHPQALPDPHHRKIELQSAQDLHYLQSNLLVSARQKLDQYLPPSAAKSQVTRKTTVISLDGVNASSEDTRQEQIPPHGEAEEDPFRGAVRGHIDAYISRIYASASHSITVNGLDATSLPPSILSIKNPTPVSQDDSLNPHEEKEGVDFSYEAYDTRLQKQVADMYREVEELTVQVGQLRREAPKQGAGVLGMLLSEAMETEDAEFQRDVDALKEESLPDQGLELKLAGFPDRWFEDRVEMYERARSGLAALAGLPTEQQGEGRVLSTAEELSLTETMGKVQRARTVAMEFE